MRLRFTYRPKIRHERKSRFTFYEALDYVEAPYSMSLLERIVTAPLTYYVAIVLIVLLTYLYDSN